MDALNKLSKPRVAVLAGEELFASFFNRRRQARLSRIARWTLCPVAQLEDGVASTLPEADALITTWDSPHLSSEVLRRMSSVKMIAHCGGEVKRRFDTALFQRLVIVNTPEPMVRPTAELGAAFLLYLARGIDQYRSEMRTRSNRIYQDVHIKGSPAGSLLGREVGMIGFGRIGHALVEMLQGFGTQWRVYDPYARRTHDDGSSVQFDSLNQILKRSSLLVLTAAATERTRLLLNRERLAMLPDGAAVINIARGSLIDLDALTREVKRGRLRCALDVTDPEEPLPIDHPLRKMPGAMLTPHVGGGGRDTRGEMADAAMDELERFFRGDAVQHRVTKNMLSRMT